MQKVLQAVRTYLSQTDIWLWLFALAISATSMVLIYGILQTGYERSLAISMRHLAVQGGAVVIGMACAVVLSLIDYHFLCKMWFIHAPMSYLLVLVTFLIGVGAPARPDDKRWLIIPGIDVWFQPSEVLKISFILVFALHIIRMGDSLNKLPNVLSLCVHAAIPVVLIHLQGDTGTALLVGSIALVMLFMAGIGWRYILPAIAGGAAMVPVLWNFVLDEFQKKRILTLLNQDTADPLGDYYQQYRSKLAIGMGGMTGKGLLGDHVYIPEMHTDFIFSFLCESFGFMGALGLLAVMLLLCVKMLFNSSRAQDFQGSLICAGVFAMIMVQFCINIGMCLSILPVIGNTFPFLSYGGSSTLTNYLGIGLLQSVYRTRKRDLFASS